MDPGARHDAVGADGVAGVSGGSGTGVPEQVSVPASTPPSFVAAAPSAEWDVLAPVAPTGDGRVDTALALLEDLRETPVVEHVPVYDEVQRRLQDVLADIDDEEPA